MKKLNFLHKKAEQTRDFEKKMNISNMAKKKPKQLSSEDFESLDFNHSQSMWNNFLKAILKMGGGRLSPHVQTS